jgi:hypothetical protein
MAHLSVNGIALECSTSAWEPMRLGEVARSLNGAPRSSVRVRKRDYRFTTDTTGTEVEEAQALQSLVEGEGHAWTFESDLASSRGLLPLATSGTVTVGLVGGVHSQCLFAQAGAEVTWALGHSGSWTALYFREESGTFAHYVVRNTLGTVEVWRNDEKTDVDPGVITLPGGNLQLEAAGADETIDDLVFLPYAVPDNWPGPLWEYHMLNEWPALPFVRASGPGVPSGGIAAIGQVGTVQRVHMVQEDGTFGVGEVFDFSLIAT